MGDGATGILPDPPNIVGYKRGGFPREPGKTPYHFEVPMSEIPKTILVVDDEDSIRNLAALVLEDDGFQVLKARHSDEALLLLDSYKDAVHLLLTDVKMDPFLTGCELAKCIRIMRPDIGVLYISGFPNNPMVQQEVTESRASFLAKPFSPKDLLEKVRDVLSAAGHPA